MKIFLLCILAAVAVYATPATTRATNATSVHEAKVAPAKQPPREFFGLRLGMSEDAARSRLKKIASQQKEEREEEEGGEQEVWILKRDSRFNYLLVKFTKEHRLNWITVVAHPKRVRYADIAGLDLATKATDGINYSYKWKVEPTKQQPGYLIIARGSSDEFLTSYSVYPTR
jgi:L-2-hydroxyglutarate oxidase LhgO